MPSVASLVEFRRAVAEFPVTDLPVTIEPAARAAAQRSLDESGLLLLGEVHGVAENPLVIRALLAEFGLPGLALEWSDELVPVVSAFLAGQPLAGHWLLWPGDGRITAGHLAVLRDRAAAGPLRLTLFDGALPAGASWSERDAAMAARVLADTQPGTLVVAGNAHTPVRRTGLGVPMGAFLTQRRPGVAEVRISYACGGYYNIGPRRFSGHDRPGRPPRLSLRDGTLILELPTATEAVVPQRPLDVLAAPHPDAADQCERADVHGGRAGARRRPGLDPGAADQAEAGHVDPDARRHPEPGAADQ